MSSKSNSSAIRRRTVVQSTSSTVTNNTTNNESENNQVHIFDIVAQHHKRINEYEDRIGKLEQLVADLSARTTSTSTPSPSTDVSV